MTSIPRLAHKGKPSPTRTTIVLFDAGTPVKSPRFGRGVLASLLFAEAEARRDSDYDRMADLATAVDRLACGYCC